MWYCFFNSAGKHLPRRRLLAACEAPCCRNHTPIGHPHRLTPLTHTYRMGGRYEEMVGMGVHRASSSAWWSSGRLSSSPAHVHPAGLDHRGVQRQHRPRPHQQDGATGSRPCHPAARWSGAGPGGRTGACRTIRSYSFYADHDEYNSWSHRASGSVWYDYSRSTRFSILQLLRLHEGPAVRGHQPGQFPGHHHGERRGRRLLRSHTRTLRPHSHPGQRSRPQPRPVLHQHRQRADGATSSVPRTRPMLRWHTA